MNGMPANQKGGALVTLIILALAAYGVFVGIQYVPLHIEATSVNSILESIGGSHRASPLSSVSEVEAKIKNLLNINEMRELEDKFQVRQHLGDFIIEVQYERKLNLLFENRVIQYDKSLTLP